MEKFVYFVIKFIYYIVVFLTKFKFIFIIKYNIEKNYNGFKIIY